MRYYSLRYCLTPTLDFDKRINNLVDFCKEAEIDDVMFFIAPEELFIGHITKEQSKGYIDVIQKAKAILAEKGITSSLNPWFTIGHWSGGRTLKEDQNFRTMVGADGTTSEVVACPLCENWRDYFIDLMNYYVQTIKPDILWIEDDFRLSNHEPINLGCFCEEHVRLFNEKAGTNFDRQGVIDAIFSDEKYRKIHLDLARYSIENTMQIITSSIKGQQKFGLMTGGACLSEGKRYGKLFEIMRANSQNKPYNRICLFSYRQRGLQEYAWSINSGSMLVRFLTGDSANCVSEMENFPYSYYTKSANYTKYQMLTTAPLRCMGDTLNIFPVNGNGVVDYKRYAKVLKEVKPYLSAVTDLKLEDLQTSGIHVLVNQDSAYTVKGAKTFGKLNPTESWIFAYLEQLGFNCAYTSDIALKGKTVACSGQVLRNYTNDQIKALFANNTVIITGASLEVLKERNLLSLVGVENYKLQKERSGNHSIEEWAFDNDLYGVEKLRTNFQFFCGDYYDVEYAKNTVKTVYTNVLSQYEEIVGTGIVKTGSVIILPYQNITSELNVPISLISPLRAEAIKCALIKDVGDSEIFYVQGETVCPYTFKFDGGTYLVLVNFADDNFDDIRLTSNLKIDGVQILTPSTPTFTNVSFDRQGNNYVICHELKAQESVVLKLK